MPGYPGLDRKPLIRNGRGGGEGPAPGCLFRPAVAYSEPAIRITPFRIAMPVNEAAQSKAPSTPISGKSLAVFGSFLGAGSAAAVSTAGAGAAGGGKLTTRIGTTAFLCGGGGGVFSPFFFFFATFNFVFS